LGPWSRWSKVVEMGVYLVNQLCGASVNHGHGRFRPANREPTEKDNRISRKVAMRNNLSSNMLVNVDLVHDLTVKVFEMDGDTSGAVDQWC
jgi:hypothetical protein